MADERPLQRRRFVPAAEVRRAFAGLPRVDYQQLRADLDEFLDQDPTPRWGAPREALEMEPIDIVVGGEGEGLTISVLRRQFPDAADVEGAGWLQATLTAKAGMFSGVLVDDPCLRIDELQRWCRSLEQLDTTRRGEVVLDPTEPYLYLTLAASVGRVEAAVVLRGQGLFQGPELRFTLDLDWSSLTAIIASLREIEAAYSSG